MPRDELAAQDAKLTANSEMRFFFLALNAHAHTVARGCRKLRLVMTMCAARARDFCAEPRAGELWSQFL